MTKRELTKLRNAAKRGAKFLDTRVPGWPRKVKLTALDLFSCRSCVLGQLFGHYCDGVRELELGLGIMSDAKRLGFCLNLPDAHVPAWNEAWKDEIRARRNPRQAA